MNPLLRNSLSVIGAVVIAALLLNTFLKQHHNQSSVDRALASIHLEPQSHGERVKIENSGSKAISEGEYKAPTQAELWNSPELKICKKWIEQKMDLGGHELSQYHVDLVRFEDNPPYVQFAHKQFMADVISEYGIEAVDGGFPWYFSLTLNADGTEVTDHYASCE